MPPDIPESQNGNQLVGQSAESFDWSLPPQNEGNSNSKAGEAPNFMEDENDYYARPDSQDSDDDDNNIVFNDLQLFFHAIGEPELANLFIRHKVNLGQLLNFDEQDLKNCGVELVGDRKKILASVGQMHCEKWAPTSLHDMTEKALLSSPGIYVALNDINKHLEYIGVTFKYIKRRIQKDPSILELGKDYVGAHKIDSELDDVLKTSKTSYMQMKELKSQITKHLNNPNMRPPNYIDRAYVRQVMLRKNLIPVLSATLLFLASATITYRLRTL